MVNQVEVPKYVAAKEAQISGFAMQAFQKSGETEGVLPTFEKYMKQYGYDSTDIDTEAWYPLQLYFDICKDLKENAENFLILVAIGTKVIESAQFPPEINSVATAMKMLMDTHHMNLKNVPEHDGYHSLDVSEDRVTFVEQTSFPHDVMYGYIHGLAKRYTPEGKTPFVEREYLNPENPDGDGAKYLVTVED
jgi:hypothetical protein